eukprot:scaffold159999_cov36-Cyclotella_meneghiniana.AAC.2
MTTSPKRISSHPPDVTVIVGSGKTKQEFQCYGILLAAASPVLDAMLSSGMAESENKRIEFPDKDPAVWQLFLKCIDTARAVLSNTQSDDSYEEEEDQEADSEEMTRILNESNVRSIVPLFHELQMDEYLKGCDHIIRLTASDSNAWGDNEARSQLLELLSFSTKYGLDVTRNYVQRQIGIVLERFCWGSGDQDDFDIHTVEEIVGICRPFKLRDEDDEVIYKGTIQSSTKAPPKKKQRSSKIVAKGIYQSCNCENLWAQISSCIEEDLSVLHLEEINNGKLFSRMVYHELKQYHTSMESELKQKAASLIGKKDYSIIIDNDSMEKYSRKVSNFGWSYEPATMGSIQSGVNSAVNKLVPFNAGSGNFSRTYQVKSDEKELYMVFKPSLSSDNRYERYWSYKSSSDYSTQPCTLRYSEPDLTVVVGNGKGATEFHCHKMILSFASAKLDSMVRRSHKRLFLPHLDPDGWQQFYLCIHPSHNGCTLNEENAEALAPMFSLFAEFEMHNYLKASFTATELPYEISDFRPSVGRVGSITTLLKCIVGKGFENLQQKVERTLMYLFDEHYLWICYNYEKENGVISEVNSMKDLVSVCLPIQRNSAKDPFTSESCPILWQGIYSIIEEKLKNVTFHRVGICEIDMFSNFVFHLLLNESERILERERLLY